MANPITMASLNLADHVYRGIWEKEAKGGIISKLAPQESFLVGDTDIYTFTGTPKAELVGEDAQKSSMAAPLAPVTARSLTFQVTYRFTNKLKWADEDYQLNIVSGLIKNIRVATDRALDLAGIHGINPATGTVSSLIPNYIMKSGNNVSSVETLDEAAQTLQNNGYIANGIAFDPVYAGKLARMTKSSTDNTPLYPELGFGFNVTSFRGLGASSSDTVSGRQEIAYAASADVPQAIMADWDAFKWGIVRNIPLEVIETGDPDGNGDLKRKNQIAIRAEVELAFAILDGKAFAVVCEEAPASV